ncbi:MAG: caspase family protein [Deltaproteobacteria bacterium]|nr:caspase family protein [Deltaproteobacteria bacterium]
MSSKLKVAFLFCSLFLTSCMTATPNLHLIIADTQMTLTQPAINSKIADISPDGKYLLMGGVNVFAHWDISRGMLVNRYQVDGIGLENTVPAAFVSNDKYALSGGKELTLWDLSSGKVVRKIGNDPVSSIVVRSDGKVALTCDESAWAFKEDKINIYDVNSGHKTIDWDAGYSGGIIVLSPDGKYLLSSGGGGRDAEKRERGVIYLWDVSNGRLVNTFEGTGNNKGWGHAVLTMAFSHDGKYALSGGTDGSIRLWDISSGAELRTIQGHTGWVGTNAVAFSPDGRFIVSASWSDGLAKLWDISSGSLIREFKVSDDRFASARRFTVALINGWVAFTPDGKRIVYMGSDASFRIFDVATGKEIATLIQFDNGEWLAVTSEGYYNASEKAAQYLNVVYEGKSYSVDRFYDVFYRPDIVAAKLRGEDISRLVTITMRDAIKSPPPVVEFSTQISNTDQPRVKVCYQVKNGGGGIGEVRLFHNGKLIQSDGYYREVAKSPVEKTRLVSLNSRAIYDDMRSVSIKGKTDSVSEVTKPKGDTWEDCISIDPIAGKNEVSIAAFNGSNTVQSDIKTIHFNSRVKSDNPHIYILSIGIDRYKDGSITLKYAAKDAKDLEEKIKAQSATLYEQQNIHCARLTDREATKVNIIGKIDELARLIKPDDSFILCVAGHGVLLQNQYYMLTHDFSGQVSDMNVISSNEIVEISKKIKSLSQLFIFDTCHAGGVDYIVSGLYDARMSVLAKKMGLHIYASANDKQAAIDGYQGNGLFTHSLLDGLNNNRQADKNKDGKITIVGLGEYSRGMTKNISKQIGHEQTPLIINFGKDSPIYKLQ